MNITPCLGLLAGLLLTSLGLAQTASFSTYGTGCNPSQPPPLIANSGLPVLGTTFTVSFVALPAGRTPVSEDWPIFLIGLQQAQVPVPVLSPSQPAGCNLLTTTDIAMPMPWLGSSFQNQVQLAVPFHPALAGGSVYLQWAELYSRCSPTCTPTFLRVTNAAIAKLGF